MVHEMWRWDMNEENIFSSGFSTSALQGLRDRPLHLCAHTRAHTHTHTLQSTHSRYLLNAGESLAGNSISSSAHMPPQRWQNLHTSVCTQNNHRHACGDTQALRRQIDTDTTGTHLVGGHMCLPVASLPCLQVTKLPDHPCLEGT